VHDVDEFDSLVEQVSSWIKEKRAKRHRRKSGHHHHHLHLHRHRDDNSEPASPKSGALPDPTDAKQRRESNASDESVDLENLERIVKHTQSLRRSSTRKTPSLKSKASVRKLLRKQSSASDTEYFDGDVLVPSCDAVLDNTKTLAYTGGASDASDESESEELKRVRSYRDGDAWSRFKFEIVRLSHTLRLKGWRKVSMEMSGSIEVQRLSGALTNAVYVVSPPSDLPLEKKDNAGNVSYSKPPPKLLLRIYGPQVSRV
jgi:choline kinase